MIIDCKTNILIGYGLDDGSLPTTTGYLVQFRIVVNKVKPRITYDKYMVIVYGQ